MIIEKAQMRNLDEIIDIYSSARLFMKESGNGEQWGDGYPSRELVLEDLLNGNLYTVTGENEILAVFFMSYGEELDYNTITEGKWQTRPPYGILHRVAVSQKARGKGVAAFIFSEALKRHGSIRIDTHRNNIPMQRALLKFGFSYAGIIYTRGGAERLAYEISAE